jgi:hypothetical protein
VNKIDSCWGYSVKNKVFIKNFKFFKIAKDLEGTEDLYPASSMPSLLEEKSTDKLLNSLKPRTLVA